MGETSAYLRQNSLPAWRRDRPTLVRLRTSAAAYRARFGRLCNYLYPNFIPYPWQTCSTKVSRLATSHAHASFYVQHRASVVVSGAHYLRHAHTPLCSFSK